MKLNTTTKKEKVYTHQGARAVRVSPELELRRSVMATMLWEDQFYEDGQTIADRISSLVKNDFSDAWLGAAPTMSTLYIEKSDFAKAEPFVRDFINTNNE